MYEHFFGKWPLNLDQDGSQQLPGVQKLIFDAKFGNSHSKKPINNLYDHFLGLWSLYLDQDGSQESRINHSILQMYLSILNTPYNYEFKIKKVYYLKFLI